MVDTKVIHLEATQITEASELVGRAFYDDPLTAYLFPAASDSRVRKLQRLCNFMIRYGCACGSVYTTAEPIKGIAIWIPPGHPSFNIVQVLQAGLLTLPFQIGLTAFWRQIKILNKLEALHERDMSQQHWYLAFLGVAPNYQGQGVGSALLQPILKQADSEGLPCYLETFTEKNTYFYRKHGFETIKTVDLPSINVRLWTMKRESQH